MDARQLRPQGDGRATEQDSARVTVLGEVSASRGQTTAVLGSGKALGLLALLAVDRRRLRSDEQVARALWAAGDLEHLRSALRVHASDLRHRLEPVGIGLEWAGGGYRLVLGPACVDIDQVRGHVDRADAAVRFRDFEHASREYALALRLWAGEPFANVDAPFVGPVREDLAYWHRTIRQNRLEADLRLGMGALRLEESRELCALDPFDERACRHRMTALLQAGRRAEALEVYATFRRSLVDGLGVEPGAELAAVHSAALRGVSGGPVLGRAAS